MIVLIFEKLKSDSDVLFDDSQQSDLKCSPPVRPPDSMPLNATYVICRPFFVTPGSIVPVETLVNEGVNEVSIGIVRVRLLLWEKSSLGSIL